MTHKKSKTTSKVRSSISKKTRVLYQNLNGVWYAFTEIDGSVFCGKIIQSTDKNLVKYLKNKGVCQKEAA